MKSLAVTLAAVLILSSCAKQPDEIGAADIGQNVYRGNSCAQLSKALLTHKHNLETLSAEQKSAADGDAMGVLLLGLPLSSMSGNDKETAIAVTKGHIQQIEVERQRKGCKS